MHSFRWVFLLFYGILKPRDKQVRMDLLAQWFHNNLLVTLNLSSSSEISLIRSVIAFENASWGLYSDVVCTRSTTRCSSGWGTLYPANRTCGSRSNWLKTTESWKGASKLSIIWEVTLSEDFLTYGPPCWLWRRQHSVLSCLFPWRFWRIKNEIRCGSIHCLPRFYLLLFPIKE